MESSLSIRSAIYKLLFFKISGEEILELKNKHLFAGITGTWIVGMGRYWDDPGASLLQKLGLGSVIYIFALSFFIWLLIKPFIISNWSYFRVLCFISLTSFPAIFYAIPVEKFYSLKTANTINVWFLAIVASWRLALLYYFLKTFTRLNPLLLVTTTLMPICLIITSLTILNLHRAVFAVMGGVRNPTAHDSSYIVLNILTFLSALFILPLLLIYISGIYFRRKNVKKDAAEK